MRSLLLHNLGHRPDDCALLVTSHFSYPLRAYVSLTRVGHHISSPVVCASSAENLPAFDLVPPQHEKKNAQKPLLSPVTQKYIQSHEQ